MSERHPIVHDGQADAMPCQCPACRSPFITNRAHLRIVPDRADHIAPAAPVQRDHMREGRAC